MFLGQVPTWLLDGGLTFDGEVYGTALLSGFVDDLTGVLSTVRPVHVEQLQENLVVLQGKVTASSRHHLLGSSEPLEFERRAAFNHR